jgi:hypothetical protein
MRSELFGASIYPCVINKKDMFCPQIKILYSKIIPAPLYWRTEAFLRKWQCGSNPERKFWTIYEFADFFLVWAASLFTLRTFGAQINWRVISSTVRPCLIRIAFCQTNRLFILLERAEKEIHFSMANGKFKMKMDIDRHGPRLMPNNCKDLNPPYFSLPSTFKTLENRCN